MANPYGNWKNTAAYLEISRTSKQFVIFNP